MLILIRNIFQSLTILLILCQPVHAQDTAVAGIYLLRGVTEMASGFNLKPDSSFEFFFSYGALDRTGSGRWTMNGDTVIFNSRSYPGSDYRLIDSSKTDDPNITVQVKLADKLLYNYIYAYGKLKKNEYPDHANSEGYVQLLPSTDSVHFYFEFVPERISVFAVDNKKYNDLVFVPEPWLMEYFFSQFRLIYKDGKLAGKHPLLTKEKCDYLKSN